MTKKHVGQFVKGVSGNPSGRPKQESAHIREELAKHSADIIQKLLDKALIDGDLQALKMILDRLVPPLKAVSLPSAVHVPADATLSEMATAIIQQSLNGEVEPSDALQLLNALQLLKPVSITDNYIKRENEPDPFGLGIC
ncbi:MAG: DUF5681 domain-containing protein [Gammaproteobacteria bacterium]|nr:DUF5681 domain-containing protein [Gammaproteobacteria bacterium]